MIIAAVTALLFSCTPNNKQDDALSAWNDTPVKQQILNYVALAQKEIPVEDRVAVFDMDGTIACETPLWFEMATAVYGMHQQYVKQPELLKLKEYQYAKKLWENPADTTVLNHWVVDGVNYLDSIILKAFTPVDFETSIDMSAKYLMETKDKKFNMILGDMFYEPMLELIELLQKNEFNVYIVSGSMTGVIWSICPQTIGFNRAHLIGTRQALTPIYQDGKTILRIEKAIFPPKNDGNGKSLNIYNAIGKIPVFAFGNTTGDFGMFHLTATSKYPHMELMLNHDDDQREYAYPPYHGTAVPAWQDSLEINKWIQVDMSTQFKTVWKEKNKI